MVRSHMPTGHPTPFAELLSRLATRFPSRRAFAIAIGTDPSRLSRAMNGDPTMFDVLRCLYVARATRENPSVVLRAAGKGEIADLLEELYGEPKTPEALMVLHAFKRLGADVQAPVLDLLKDLYQVAPPPQRTQNRPVAVEPPKKRRAAGHR
jgi:hypothetical protein